MNGTKVVTWLLKDVIIKPAKCMNPLKSICMDPTLCEDHPIMGNCFAPHVNELGFGLQPGAKVQFVIG